MKVYTGRAFTYPRKIDGREVIGNPTSVVVCENRLPTKEKMSQLAIEQNQPITVFFKPQNE